MVIEALVVGLWGIFAVELVSASLWTARPLAHSHTHSLQATLLKHAHSNALRDIQPASSDNTYLVHSHESSSLPSTPCPPYLFSLSDTSPATEDASI
jgi:hypothetical protein